MSSDQSGNDYIRPEERIYSVATDKNEINWKSFLYELIHREGLDPWELDLTILTKKYLEAVKGIDKLDFDISGKFLTIAVFLLKTKAENYIDHDLRGIDQRIEAIQHEGEDFGEDLEALEGFDDHLEELNKKKKEDYAIKVRNPIARKRKVNIFDLIKALDKTFEQSNKRKANFFARSQGDGKYEGPVYEKKPKDLKQIIEELYEVITEEFTDKKGHVLFSHLTQDVDHKQGILEKFIPLLHLHNQTRVELQQDDHFGEIRIHKVNK